MGRFIAIKATKDHGWYVEDAWTGATVCDMYYMKNGEVVHYKDAEVYAKNIARHLDLTTEE